MENELRRFCQHCGNELPLSHTGKCPKCGKSGIHIEAKSLVAIGVKTFWNSRARHKDRQHKGKFSKEIVQGYFPSGDLKIKDGVVIERIIDKEKDEYNQVVKNAVTGEILHEEHEPLTLHKSKKKRL